VKRTRVAILLAALAVGLAACGGEEDDTANPADPNSLTEEVTTAEGKESPYATTAEDDDGGDEGEGSGDPEAGAEVFASAGCGGCHTLDAAGSSGNVGPNLDDTDPDFDLVVETVSNGRGQMPSFKDQLSEKQIRDVTAYVSEAAGG
jgi:mono/diheme cytochrome c family protein